MKRLKFRKSLRILHRDLGYFFIGLSVIYGVSGIILNYKLKGKDPAYKEYTVSETIQKNLSIEELKTVWYADYAQAAELNRIIPQDNAYRLFIKGGIGYYNPQSGYFSYSLYKEKKLVKFINVIHYNTGKKFTWLANIFAGSIIFFALSGMLMLKGKKGFIKRGVWFMIAGIILPIVWYIVVMQ